MNTLLGILIGVIIACILITGIYFIIDWFWPYNAPPEILRLKERLRVIDPSLATFDIRENPRESYTKRKSRIFVCLRDPMTHVLYDDNTLMYVTLHECAHVISPGRDHDADFERVFNDLLRKAERVGMYDPNVPFPSKYCGRDYVDHT